MHIMPHNVHIYPQPETIEDSEVVLNDPGWVARAHHIAALSD